MIQSQTETPETPMSGAEQQLEQERAQLVEAIDWIDAERKRLSRFCFAETRKKWNGDKQRGRSITLAKKQDEWLYRRRCTLRKRIGDVNATLKDARRARNGTVSASFGSVFVELARKQLPEELFKAIAEQATIQYGDCVQHEPADFESVPRQTVLQRIRIDLEAFKASNESAPEPVPVQRQDSRETQSDFRIGQYAGDRRIYAATPALHP